MNAILDSSSLLALVRYYLPFDKNDSLYNLLQEKFENGEIIILDKVYEEVQYLSGGIILTSLPFLKEKKKHIKTGDLVPSKSFYNLLENHFCNKEIKKLKGISDTAFEIEKNHFLQSADANLILYALSIKAKNPTIVTEETKASNDGKLFKKIPENCRCIHMPCCSLPELLKTHLGINLGELFS
jgi:hypothetical protein